jgi:branched-chain amino acid aminotransferase
MFSYIFFNGKLIKGDKIRISSNDPGFLYGDGLFETIRSYNGFIFKLDEHLQRLFSSSRILRHNIDFDKDYLVATLDELVTRNKLRKCDAYIKIMITRGNYKDRLKFDYSSKSNLIITASKLIPYPDEYYKDGIKVISSTIRRNSLGNDLYRHKLINYFENIFARNEAYFQGAQEAIFLTKDRIILEGSTSNIFFVKNKVIHTPPITQNILPGITRDTVIDLCSKNDLKVSQRKIHYRDITCADEIFLTSSLMEIMPVREFDKYKIGERIPGNTTSGLMILYKLETEKNTQ